MYGISSSHLNPKNNQERPNTTSYTKRLLSKGYIGKTSLMGTSIVKRKGDEFGTPVS